MTIFINGEELSPLCSKVFGVAWDENADTYARTGYLTGVAVGSSPGNALLPIHAMMKRCVINNAGVVQYYLNEADSTKKRDGSASVLTGADGQVMVEIPAFYYKYSYSGTIHTWEISQTPLSGYTLHPAFIKNKIVPNRYIGAYEGVLYDTSAAIYTDGFYQTAVSCVFANADSSLTIASRSGVFSKLTVGNKIVISGTAANNGTKTVASLVSATKITIAEAVTNGTDAATVIQTEKNWAAAGDVLASVSGKAPINYGTRANFRAVALNRGTEWRQQDYDLISAIQLLYLVEYASFYSQSVIGAGLTDWASATWLAYSDYNPINNTGLSNAKGNTTFNLSNGDGVVGSYMTYRGIENWYGHLWKWVDGINFDTNIKPYVTNTQPFADDTATNYTALNVTLPASGWQNNLQQQSRGFLPISVGAPGSATAKITDYLWTSGGGWRVVALGGDAYAGAYAGAFCLTAASASSALDRNFGGRLAF